MKTPTAVLLAATGLAAFIAGLAVSGAATEAVPEVLRAQRIELVDERGTVRARLNTEPSGEVVFRLIDEAGQIRVKLGASRTGSGLLLANDLTEPGVHLLANDRGSTIKLKDRENHEYVIEPLRQP